MMAPSADELSVAEVALIESLKKGQAVLPPEVG
jgi:hypothetical protein